MVINESDCAFDVKSPILRPRKPLFCSSFPARSPLPPIASEISDLIKLPALSPSPSAIWTFFCCWKSPKTSWDILGQACRETWEMETLEFGHQKILKIFPKQVQASFLKSQESTMFVWMQNINATLDVERNPCWWMSFNPHRKRTSTPRNIHWTITIKTITTNIHQISSNTNMNCPSILLLPLLSNVLVEYS